LGNDKSILFIPPVHWNYYPYRDQELPACIAEKGTPCIYLNPVRYKGSAKAIRFSQVNPRNTPKNIQVIDRVSIWRKSVAEFILENSLNVRAVRKYKPYAVVSSDHLMSLGVCLYCKLKGIRFVFDVTDNWELVDRSLAGKVYKFILKPLLARYSFAVTCTSHRQFQYFESRRRRNTFLISNGINPLIQKQLSNLETKLPPVQEVNFIGSLRDWYDFDLLIEVFEEFPEIVLNIYGEGPLYPELLAKTRSILNIHVHGNIENQKTAEILFRTLFGILPLKVNELNQSTCPIKLFDYWGASKAVISTPVEEVKRVGGDSLLYAANKEEFILCINRLMNDRVLSLKLGAEGKQKIDEQHNYHTITDQFLQLLNIY